MEMIDRRTLISAIAAITITACNTGDKGINLTHGVLNGLDSGAIHDIAQSYFKATEDPVGRKEKKRLIIKGELDIAAVRKAAIADFNNQRVFRHNGWILSHTEGRLFTLLSRSIPSL